MLPNDQVLGVTQSNNAYGAWFNFVDVDFVEMTKCYPLS